MKSLTHYNFNDVNYMLSQSTNISNSHDHCKLEILKLLKKYPYPIDRPEHVKTGDLRRWIDENGIQNFYIMGPGFPIRGYDYELYIYSIFFKSEEDALAFKLAWS